MENKSQYILEVCNHIDQILKPRCCKIRSRQQGNMKNSDERVPPKSNQIRLPEIKAEPSCFKSSLNDLVHPELRMTAPCLIVLATFIFIIVCLPGTKHCLYHRVKWFCCCEKQYISYNKRIRILLRFYSENIRKIFVNVAIL